MPRGKLTDHGLAVTFVNFKSGFMRRRYIIVGYQWWYWLLVGHPEYTPEVGQMRIDDLRRSIDAYPDVISETAETIGVGSNNVPVIHQLVFDCLPTIDTEEIDEIVQKILEAHLQLPRGSLPIFTTGPFRRREVDNILILPDVPPVPGGRIARLHAEYEEALAKNG